MKGYNTLLGSHYDHYFIEYDSYDVDSIPEKTFNIDSSKWKIGNKSFSII